MNQSDDQLAYVMDRAAETLELATLRCSESSSRGSIQDEAWTPRNLRNSAAELREGYAAKIKRDKGIAELADFIRTVRQVSDLDLAREIIDWQAREVNE